MSIGRWYVRRGRIDRPTYWLHYFLPFFVLYLVVEFAVVIPTVISAGQSGTASGSVPLWPFWLIAVVYLLSLPPQFSSQTTRLHDRGHSAWWLLFVLLPLAGGIVLLVQMCLPGDPGPNRYGPPPRR